MRATTDTMSVLAPRADAPPPLDADSGGRDFSSTLGALRERHTPADERPPALRAESEHPITPRDRAPRSTASRPDAAPHAASARTAKDAHAPHVTGHPGSAARVRRRGAAANDARVRPTDENPAGGDAPATGFASAPVASVPATAAETVSTSSAPPADVDVVADGTPASDAIAVVARASLGDALQAPPATGVLDGAPAPGTEEGARTVVSSVTDVTTNGASAIASGAGATDADATVAGTDATADERTPSGLVPETAVDVAAPPRSSVESASGTQPAREVAPVPNVAVAKTPTDDADAEGGERDETSSGAENGRAVSRASREDGPATRRPAAPSTDDAAEPANTAAADPRGGRSPTLAPGAPDTERAPVQGAHTVDEPRVDAALATPHVERAGHRSHAEHHAVENEHDAVVLGTSDVGIRSGASPQSAEDGSAQGETSYRGARVATTPNAKRTPSLGPAPLSLGDTSKASPPDTGATAVGDDASPLPAHQPGADTVAGSEVRAAPAARGETGTIAPWAERVVESVRVATLRGGGEMRLRLEPAGLGHIDVRISLAHDGVHAAIVAEHDGTRTLLRNEQHLLHAALERSELRLAGFSVDLGFGASTGTFGGDERGGPALARTFATPLEQPAAAPPDTIVTAVEPGRLSVRV